MKKTIILLNLFLTIVLLFVVYKEYRENVSLKEEIGTNYQLTIKYALADVVGLNSNELLFNDESVLKLRYHSNNFRKIPNSEISRGGEILNNIQSSLNNGNLNEMEKNEIEIKIQEIERFLDYLYTNLPENEPSKWYKEIQDDESEIIEDAFKLIKSI